MEMDAGGGGGGTYYEPEFRNIDVVPGDLCDFADLVADDHQALRGAWLRALDDLGRNRAPGLGGNDNGLFEGAEFLRAYYLTLGAQLELMNDALQGLETLGAGASKIHDDYYLTDESGAAGVEGAFGAYERSAVDAAFGQPDPAAGGAGDE